MTTTDANGIIFLEETDAISPFHTLINGLQTATSTAISQVPVNNVSASSIAGGIASAPGGLYTTASWNWTPSRSGIANVAVAMDIMSGVDYGLCSLTVIHAGISGAARTMYYPLTRAEISASSGPFRVTSGVAVAMSLYVTVYGNSVTINGGHWETSIW